MLRLRNYLILLIFFIWETWATGPFTCPKRAQWASYWTTKWQQGKATDRLNSTFLTSNICVFFFPLHIWVPWNPIQFWHYLESMQTSQVKGSAPKNVSHFGHQPQVWASWTTDQPALKFGGSQDPLLGFYDLLNRLTRLRKALYLQSLVYYNEYSSETAKWKRSTGQETGETGRAHPCHPGALSSQHLQVFTRLEALQTLCFH